jgi:hypothetical protein
VAGQPGTTAGMTDEQARREADADRAAEAERDAADPNRKADTTKEAAQEPPD